MQIKCPNCGVAVEQNRQPSKNDAGAGEAWVCFKCVGIICINCYTTHTQNTHPEAYGPIKRYTEGGKKNKKDKKR